MTRKTTWLEVIRALITMALASWAFDLLYRDAKKRGSGVHLETLRAEQALLKARRSVYPWLNDPALQPDDRKAHRSAA